MQTRSISVTEAARNFSECVNRTRYQGLTFILHRNGVPVARIVPELEERREAVREDGTADAIAKPDDLGSVSEPTRSLW
jgi:antitoxin (DNA-binding transcriptional repressor) of toxin-antitoxin stability system